MSWPQTSLAVMTRCSVRRSRSSSTWSDQVDMSCSVRMARVTTERLPSASFCPGNSSSICFLGVAVEEGMGEVGRWGRWGST